MRRLTIFGVLRLAIACTTVAVGTHGALLTVQMNAQCIVPTCRALAAASAVVRRKAFSQRMMMKLLLPARCLLGGGNKFERCARVDQKVRPESFL